MKKLKKQFWFYGVIPITFLYLIDVYIAGEFYELGFNDCLVNVNCTKLFYKEYYYWQNIFYILSLSILIYTIWNGYRVFVLSRNEEVQAKRIKVRIYVIIFPLFAIFLSPFLSLISQHYFSNYFLLFEEFLKY